MIHRVLLVLAGLAMIAFGVFLARNPRPLGSFTNLVLRSMGSGRRVDPDSDHNRHQSRAKGIFYIVFGVFVVLFELGLG